MAYNRQQVAMWVLRRHFGAYLEVVRGYSKGVFRVLVQCKAGTHVPQNVWWDACVECTVLFAAERVNKG